MRWGRLVLVSVSAGLALAQCPLEARGLPLAPDIPTEFFSLAPCRVVDTRLPDGPLGGPALDAGVDRAFLLSGACGIPAEATAVSVNIAVAGGTVAGNLRLHPGGSPVPLVSAINYSAGQIRSNNAVAPLSATGELAAFAGAVSGTVHLILDVNGYFAPASPTLGFGPGQSFVDVGQTAVPTYPVPLVVTLSGPAVANTFVAVSSSNPGAVVVVGGGVLIPTGQASGQVLVTGLAAGTATLTATLGTTMVTASVRALDGTEVPALVSLLPPAASLPVNGSVVLTVGLDLPAPVDGTVVTLGLVPSNAGTMPATVTVAQGQLSVTFDYMDGGLVSAATVTATLGLTTLSSALTMTAAPGLVINEVDYDQVGTDTAEYVEIHNPTGASISLANLALILVNGGATLPAEYRRVLLGPAGTIPAGGYLVIATTAVAVQGSGVRYTPPVSQWPVLDAVQNGAPDGMLLVNTATFSVIDRLSYEGSVTVTLPGFGTVNLVEGAATTALDSAFPSPGIGALARIPNGVDSNNAVADWFFTTTLTPGAANIP